jgi:hypothetical protein
MEFMATPENFDTPDNIEIRDQFIESIIFLGQNNATNTSGLSQVLLELQNN